MGPDAYKIWALAPLRWAPMLTKNMGHGSRLIGPHTYKNMGHGFLRWAVMCAKNMSLAPLRWALMPTRKYEPWLPLHGPSCLQENMSPGSL